MNKAELIATTAEKTGLSKKDTEAVITAALDAISAALAEEEKVQLSREGVRLAVVSNKPDEAVRALTERYFPGVFPVAIGNRDGWATKPAPDSVYEAMCLLGARRESTVYVGDSDVDVDTARNARLDSVIVTWGFRDENFLRAHGAQHLAHNADELYEML